MTENREAVTSRHSGTTFIAPFRDDLLFTLGLPNDETTDDLELADVVEKVRQRLEAAEKVFAVAKTLSDDDCNDDEWDAAWEQLKELTRD